MDNQDSLPQRRRGRPATPPPAGRDLDAERLHLKTWLEQYPIYKAGTISVAAKLHRLTLTHILSGYRAPQAPTLDAIYGVLKPYGYIPQSSDSKNN
jgi:hypothetical protein